MNERTNDILIDDNGAFILAANEFWSVLRVGRGKLLHKFFVVFFSVLPIQVEYPFIVIIMFPVNKSVIDISSTIHRMNMNPFFTKPHTATHTHTHNHAIQIVSHAIESDYIKYWLFNVKSSLKIAFGQAWWYFIIIILYIISQPDINNMGGIEDGKKTSRYIGMYNFMWEEGRSKQRKLWSTKIHADKYRMRLIQEIAWYVHCLWGYSNHTGSLCQSDYTLRPPAQRFSIWCVWVDLLFRSVCKTVVRVGAV